MTRMVYIAGVCAIFGAGAALVSCVRQWRAVDPQVAAVLAGPSAVAAFGERMRQRGELADGQVPPLVVQARALAAILDPPKPPVSPEPAPVALPEERTVAKTVSPLVRREREDAVSAIQPKSSSVKFSVRATSYYAAEPGRSMALIAEPGGKAGSERWVREGHKLGHSVVHEIRQGAVVFRQGQDLKEVAVDRPRETKGLVRDVHSPAMRQSRNTNIEIRDEDKPLDGNAVTVSRASGV